jgi:hypothetical protein
MELERARSRSSTERGQVQQLLAEIGKARTDDHEAKRDATYPAQPLAQQGVDDAVAARLRDRLAALDWAPPAGRRRQLRSLDPSCLLLRQLSLAPSSSGLSQEIAVNRAWRILLHWRLPRPGDLRYEGLTNQSPRKREQPGAVPLGRAFPLTSPDGQ